MKKALILALALVLALSLVSCGTASNTPAASSTAASVTPESAAPESEAPEAEAEASTATQDDIDPHSLSVEEFTEALSNVSNEKLTTMLEELEELRLVLREKAGKDQSEENVAEYYAVRDKKNAVDDEIVKRNKK